MSFSLPWWLWFMMGMFIGLFIGNKKFRNEIDELMARMMGFKKRKQTSGDEAEK